MRAYQREKGRSFGPDSLKAMGRVFDELWAEMAKDIGDNPDVVEAARLALAEAVFAVASDESRDIDVEALKTAVLRVTVLRGSSTAFRVTRLLHWPVVQAMPSACLNAWTSGSALTPARAH